MVVFVGMIEDGDNDSDLFDDDGVDVDGDSCNWTVGADRCSFSWFILEKSNCIATVFILFTCSMDLNLGNESLTNLSDIASN